MGDGGSTDSDWLDRGPEALDWLGQTPPPLGVTWDNRLHSPAELAELVRGLYALGSPRVLVPDEFRSRPGSPPGWGDRPEWARALAVHLPPTPEARWAVLDFLAARAGRAGQMSPSEARRYADMGGIVLVSYAS